VAIHEASHVFARHFFHHETGEVVISDNGDSGYCTLAAGAKRYFSDDEIKQLKQRETHLEQAIGLCAGKYGMAHCNGQKPDYGWKRSKDRAMALQHCLAYCDGDEAGAELLLAYAMRRAELLVANGWPCISEIASELSEHKKLSGDQINKILAND
jgi:hypothetical protein